MSEWSAKRFWTNASVSETEQGYTVLLDGRVIKTPAKATLVVPTHDLAAAIAQEWRDQGEKIDPTTMPMTRSANSAIDKVKVQRAEVAALIADYGGSDLLCYRAARPDRLVERQIATWDPLLEWSQITLGAPLLCAEGVMHIEQPAASVATLRAAVIDQGPFSLTALYDLVALSGSLVIGLAAQRGAFEIAALWQASILDESFQIEEWGADEEALNMQQTKARAFENAAKFQRLVSMQSYTK